jgi:flagellar protein FlbT
MLERLLHTFENAEITAGLRRVRDLLENKRRFEALKVIRRLYPLEEQILNPPRIALTA